MKNFEDIENIDLYEFDNDLVDQFISVNDLAKDKTLVGLPESLRSMFYEITFIGAAYSNPKLVRRFSESMRPKYDFTTEANRFFYNILIQLSETNGFKISEYSINAFMADNVERMKMYQKFGGYNWINFAIKMAEESERSKKYRKLL